MEGRHTYDVIVSTLECIYTKYKIEQKVCSAITDNGCNFVKASTVYSEDDNPESRSQTVLSQTNNGEVVYGNVTDILNTSESSENTFSLPPHIRCAAHTLNFVAVHDADFACSDASYKKIMRSTIGKCSAAWNKASRSTVAAEAVHNKCGLALIVPNATRWNSTFYAMEKVNLIDNQADGLLNEICELIGVTVFRPAEIALVAEYVQAMKPLASALDIMQSEHKCFMGI
jgi:hypothetical protein